ncbi:MAG: signal peptidase I, partial [Clostridia bacterium]|nr:signal peptidase I [Clostridia bacterium]
MSQEKSSKKSKAFSVICTVFTVIIAALTVAIVVNIIVCRAKHKPVSFFGTAFAIVQTNSMEPEIKVGDLILFHSCDYSEVKEGDYIVFIADESFPKEIQGQSIVHEVMEKTPDGIRTMGINNSGYDGGYRTADE